MPPMLPPTRCALTAPFHPYRPYPLPGSLGGLFSVALSVGSRPPGVTWHPDPPEPGLSSTPQPMRAQRLPGRLQRATIRACAGRLNCQPRNSSASSYASERRPAGQLRGDGGRLARRQLGAPAVPARGACRPGSAPSADRGRALHDQRDLAALQIRVLRAPSARSCSSVPRYTVSCSLVSSRAITARRCPPSSVDKSTRLSAMRCGASKNTMVRGLAGQRASACAPFAAAGRQKSLEAEPVQRQCRRAPAPR